MLTHEERVQLCLRCSNRASSFEQGTICGLTGKRPAFEKLCMDFDEDADASAHARHVQSNKKRNSTAIRYMLIITPIVLILTVLLVLFTRPDETVSLIKAEAFAHEIVRTLEAEDPSFLDDHIDVAGIINRATGVYFKGSGVDEVHKATGWQLYLGKELVWQIKRGTADLLYMGHYSANETAHIVFRHCNVRAEIEFIDLTLHQADGRIYVADFMYYNQGATFVELLNSPYAKSYFLADLENYRTDGNSIERLFGHLLDNEPESAVVYANQLSAKVLEYGPYLAGALQAHALAGSTDYSPAMEATIAASPIAMRVNLTTQVLYGSGALDTETYEALLEEYRMVFVDDPTLDLYRGMHYLNLGDIETAGLATTKGVEAMPNVRYAHECMLEVALVSNDSLAAARHLHDLEYKLEISTHELAMYLKAYVETTSDTTHYVWLRQHGYHPEEGFFN